MAGRTERDRAERDARRRARAYAARQAVHAERRRRRRRDDIVAGIVLVGVLAIVVASQVGFFTAGPGAPEPTPTASAVPTPTASVSGSPSPLPSGSPQPTSSGTPTPSATPARSLPPASLSEDRTWTGTLTLNDVELGIELDGEEAPQAVANFVALAQDGFYDGLTCHRLTTSGIFVLQCGDPNGDGTGGPGYTFGPLENVPADGVYERGVLAMARGAAEDSQGSQFFVVDEDSELPSPGYTVFGRVTDGLSTLRSAVVAKGTADGGADGPPAVPTTIREVDVR